MKQILMMLAAGAVALTVVMQAQQAPAGVRPAQPADVARAASNTPLSGANLAVIGEMPEAVETMSAAIGAAAPKNGCALPPRPITYGRPDDYNTTNGPEKLFKSPTAQAVWPNTRAFDVGGVNAAFATSFNLGSCKVCERGVTVEIRMKQAGAEFANDKVYVYLSDGTPNASGLQVVTVQNIWQGFTGTDRTMSFNIPASVVNQFIFTKNQAWVDVAVQDDTAIDWVRFTEPRF